MSEPSSDATERRWSTLVRAGVLGAALLSVLIGLVALVGVFVVALR